MKYDGVLAAVKAYPCFGEDVLSTLGGSKAGRRLQLSRWSRAGKVIRLKRGLYCLPPGKGGPDFSMRWLANTLYSPSYLSLEFMLSWYDMIPERVHTITSVTTMKTARFENSLGRFVYRHLKPALFFGFEEGRDEFDSPILMATPEKALLDYVYLTATWQSNPEYLDKNLRLQQLDQVDKKRLRQFAKRFASKKVSRAAELFLEVVG